MSLGSPLNPLGSFQPRNYKTPLSGDEREAPPHVAKERK